MAMCGVMRIEKRRRGAVRGLQIEANRTREEHERGRDFDKSDIDWTKDVDNINTIYCTLNLDPQENGSNQLYIRPNKK